jgi:uncharacterized membrane protein YfcA
VPWASALPFRAGSVPFGAISEHWTIVVNLLAGSLLGAWFGAGWAVRMKSHVLYRVIALTLVGIAIVLLIGRDADGSGIPLMGGIARAIAGVAAGFVIGVVASLLGVAGGELLIPTLVLLFGADIKLAGSLSLAVSLPTMIVGFTRYSQDNSFAVLGRNRRFVLIMAAGSIAGSFVGGQLLGIVPSAILLPVLAAILLVSAIRIWRHGQMAKESKPPHISAAHRMMRQRSATITAAISHSARYGPLLYAALLPRHSHSILSMHRNALIFQHRTFLLRV